jgi:hypothetical protein
MTFNILYNGRVLYKNLSHEECAEVLEEFSQRYYEDEEFNVNDLELEETYES